MMLLAKISFWASLAAFFIIVLLGISIAGNLSEDNYYDTYVYPEFLMKNPGYELKINGKKLTKFSRPSFTAPLVVELDTGSKKYEAFVEKMGATVPIIENELYIKPTSSTNIRLQVRKGESEIAEIKARHQPTMDRLDSFLTKSLIWLAISVAALIFCFESVYFFFLNCAIILWSGIVSLIGWCKNFIQNWQEDSTEENDNFEDKIELK